MLEATVNNLSGYFKRIKQSLPEDHRAIMPCDNIDINTMELNGSSAVCDLLRYLLYKLNIEVTKRKINSPPQLLKHCAFSYYSLFSDNCGYSYPDL